MKGFLVIFLQLWLIYAINADDENEEICLHQGCQLTSGLEVANVDSKIKDELNSYEEFKSVVKVGTWSLAYTGDYDWESQKSEDMCEYLKEMDPMILSLQQIGPFQFRDLEDCLNDYSLVRPSRSTHFGDDSYFNPIFTKNDSRLRVKESGSFWLSEQPSIRGTKLTDATEVSMANWVKMVYTHEAAVTKRGSLGKLFKLLRITVGEDGKSKEVFEEVDDGRPRLKEIRTTEFYVVNTQLESSNTYVVEEQLNILLSYMKDIVMGRRRYHVILTGNLNAESLYSSIGRYKWVENTMVDSRVAYPALSHADKGLVDYVLQNKFQSILSATLSDSKPNTDHKPVIAALLP